MAEVVGWKNREGETLFTDKNCHDRFLFFLVNISALKNNIYCIFTLGLLKRKLSIITFRFSVKNILTKFKQKFSFHTKLFWKRRGIISQVALLTMKSFRISQHFLPTVFLPTPEKNKLKDLQRITVCQAHDLEPRAYYKLVTHLQWHCMTFLNASKQPQEAFIWKGH